MKKEYRYGLLCGAGLSLWVLGEYALGFHTSSIEIGLYSGYFSILVPFVIIFSALKDEQSRLGGHLSYTSGINSGFHIAILSAAFFTLFMYVYNTYINPDWIDAMVDWERKKLILGGATDDDIGRFMERNRRVNSALGQGIMSFISTTGIGVFVTLVEIPIIRLFSSKS